MSHANFAENKRVSDIRRPTTPAESRVRSIMHDPALPSYGSVGIRVLARSAVKSLVYLYEKL